MNASTDFVFWISPFEQKRNDRVWWQLAADTEGNVTRAHP